MTHRSFCMLAAPLLLTVLATAENGARAANNKDVPRTADGHPDLSGIWTYTAALPPANLKREVNGSVSVNVLDQSGRMSAKTRVQGALPSTPAPSYKPEFQEKVKYLSERESKLDEVFYCGKPGVPRIGTPRKIIELPGEIVFFYEDMSGDPYRIIPTDGRAHRADSNPTYYGDSIGHWEGDTLVVDVTNFVDDGWFGEQGYFHTSALHVTERLWRDGENLGWQAIVDDPKVLTAPWTMPARLIKPSTEPLEESPKCVEDDGKRLLNNDHHDQR